LLVNTRNLSAEKIQFDRSYSANKKLTRYYPVVAEYLLPAINRVRLTQTGGPERVFLYQVMHLLLACAFQKPEAAGNLVIFI